MFCTRIGRLSEAGRDKRTFPVRANRFVFISATPPVDMVTGEMVRGDIETQTEASPKALKHCLEAAGTSLDKVVTVRIYAVNSGFYNAINRVYAKYFVITAKLSTRQE